MEYGVNKQKYKEAIISLMNDYHRWHLDLPAGSYFIPKNAENHIELNERFLKEWKELLKVYDAETKEEK